MKQKDESAFDYISRIVSVLDCEDGDITCDLPTTESVVEFFELFSDKYDVSCLEEVYLSIEQGEDATPYNEFVKKWKLPWRKCKTGQIIDNLYYNKSFGFIYPRVQG